MATYTKGTTFTTSYLTGGASPHGTIIYTVPSGKWAELMIHANYGAGIIQIVNGNGRVIMNTGPFGIDNPSGGGVISYAALCVSSNSFWPAKVIMGPGDLINVNGGIGGYELVVIEHSTS